MNHYDSYKKERKKYKSHTNPLNSRHIIHVRNPMLHVRRIRRTRRHTPPPQRQLPRLIQRRTKPAHHLALLLHRHNFLCTNNETLPLPLSIFLLLPSEMHSPIALLLPPTALLLLRLFLLPLPHLVEVPTAPDLRGREDNVQDGREDLERQGPARPEGAEEPHDDGSFGQGADSGGEAGAAHYFAEEEVVRGIDAVEDYGEVGPEFGDDVESACGMLV